MASLTQILINGESEITEFVFERITSKSHLNYTNCEYPLAATFGVTFLIRPDVGRIFILLQQVSQSRRERESVRSLK